MSENIIWSMGSEVTILKRWGRLGYVDIQIRRIPVMDGTYNAENDDNFLATGGIGGWWLSLWQTPVPPITTKLPSWRPSVFCDWCGRRRRGTSGTDMLDHFNTLRRSKMGDISQTTFLQMHFLEIICFISTAIFLKLVLEGPIDNDKALV